MSASEHRLGPIGRGPNGTFSVWCSTCETYIDGATDAAAAAAAQEHAIPGMGEFAADLLGADPPPSGQYGPTADYGNPE